MWADRMFRPIRQYCLTTVTNVTHYRYGIFLYAGHFQHRTKCYEINLSSFLAMFILFFNKKPYNFCLKLIYFFYLGVD